MLATTQDKQAATDKLMSMIESGKTSTIAAIENVMNSQPKDYIPKATGLTFLPTKGSLNMSFNAPEGEIIRPIHRYALGQIAEQADMPIKYFDMLQREPGDWGRELLAHSFNEVYHKGLAKKRFLVREQSGTVKGFLSDKYRRIDSRPVVEAFITGIREKGAFTYNGVVTDTKMALKAIYPQVYEPIPGELIAFGISLENSDYGNGALSVREYVHRIWCSNLAVFEETMRQIHLGKRLDDSMVYSERTYQLDSQATVSALKDVVRMRLDAGALDSRVRALQAANDKPVTSEEARAQLKKLLNKGEAEDASKAFDSPDTHNLPAGNTAWRLSNAISWIANQDTTTPERKLELARVAGDVLPKAN